MPTEKRKRKSSSLLASPSKKKKATVSSGDSLIKCFKEVRVEYPIHLPPSCIGSPLPGVIKILGNHLMKYSREFDGVALSIFDPFLLQPTASIISDQPYLHFTVTCKFLVFAPSIGSKLVGVVHSVGFDYVALLVLGTFNVTIFSQNLPQFFRDVDTDCWKRSATGETIEEGTKILFEVKEIHKSADSYSIVGSMVEEQTGILVENEEGKLHLTEIPNLKELLAKDQGEQLRRLIKKDPTESQSEYESTSEADLTPKRDMELIVPKKEKLEDDELMPAPTPRKTKKRKRTSSSKSKEDKPKRKRRKKSKTDE